MEGRQERAEPLDRAHDLSSLSGEVEAVARGDRSMQQCRPEGHAAVGALVIAVLDQGDRGPFTTAPMVAVEIHRWCQILHDRAHRITSGLLVEIQLDGA
jgi:hypothetical protein